MQQNLQGQNQPQRPSNKYKLGKVELTHWQNKDTNGKSYDSFSLAKSYKAADGKWSTIHSFNAEELPIILFLVKQALENQSMREIKQTLQEIRSNTQR